ncbi:alpha-glucan family phosphorylase [Corynebacterium ulceribovis]|uniref:alpha-glucan family phosphorylase n=1 Tax=Corynebacterium ulceribovis TaxID=487732 RepID=UPI0003A572D7|nr:alpha-glucan family phosphorylase [Corynebacterium ulceribovis]
MKASASVHVSFNLPKSLFPLWELALNLRWSWRRQTQDLFRSIDPELWESTGHNPKHLLREVSFDRLEELAHDDEFIGALRTEKDDLDAYLSNSLWFQVSHAEHMETDQATVGQTDRTSTDPIAAYFSMEFGIHPSLPIYSGGLGVLSGDHMKSASDLGVPLIGVGLLYTYGYFAQSLSADGWQQETYEAHDPKDLPVEPVLDASGKQVEVEVAFPDERKVTVSLWVAQVGRIPLLLLDTNIDANDPDQREITDRLYGGDSEHRVKQELILGVGGVRAVNAFCDAKGLARPRVAHMNEGHAGFMGLERIRERMLDGKDFDAALAEVRAASIFTTHTPVPAGIDRFDMSLVRRYLGEGLPEDKQLCPGVPLDRSIDLGREQDPSRFNMAHMGLRLSQRANGVAKLHGVVSREMFQSLYPGYFGEEVPIGSVTNGVHLPTWVKPGARDLIDRASGEADLSVADSWPKTDAFTDEELWDLRNQLRSDLVTVARKSLRESWQHRGQNEAQLFWTDRVLDPNVLTVGFARRVSTYKRLTLMLREPERLRSILLNPERPVQFVIAGKAHPHDQDGKKLMQEIVHYADAAGVRDRFLFLPDYDIELASYLISGSDIWLNNPVRPQEASGTSGMKAIMNGCMTLSISDGWWDEMPQEGYGWTIPTVDSPDRGYRDHLESQAMYDILEHQIVPMFYDRDDNGMPTEWLARVRKSMLELSPMVTSTRMVRDYTEEYYRPSDHFARLISSDRDTSRQFVNWKSRVEQAWPNVSLSQAEAAGTPTSEQAYTTAGQELSLSVDVELGTLTAEDVRVQALVGRVDGHGELIDPVTYEMSEAADGRYQASFTTNEPGNFGWTARVVPKHQLLVSPAELGLIRYL